MIWITSDTHFGHNKEFIYKARGFNSLDEMESFIIKDWQKVQDDDIVYVLGDFFLGDDYAKINEILSKLKGKIYLLRGNHDTDAKMQYYTEVWGGKIKRVEHPDDPIKYNGKVFMLSHYRMVTGSLETNPKHCVFNLHGHEHTKNIFFEERPYFYNVCMDAHGCKLISLDSVCDDIDNKIEDCLSYLK